MSTDDQGDRTQQPTERRRREARARGDVARSSDLVSALILLSASAGLWWLGPALGTELITLLRIGLSAAPTSMPDPDSVATQFLQITIRLSLVLTPILLVIVIAATLANLVQTGFLWVPTALLPQFGRLDPARTLNRWWSLPAWFNFGWSLIKLTVLLAVLAWFVRNRLASAGPLTEGAPVEIFSLSMRLIGELTLQLSMSLVVLAILDYGFQFWRQERQLMMTVEEVRREQREDQVDRRWTHRQPLAGSVSISTADAIRRV
ncbi:MAG: EscU/YscU/HrcU family type III secretion system export apparatus switch protein [Planctomycetes bacterium]|nr:EscU/YscU/HrcU family type III secretion system export apparatus switch protein [Planctomycetota bacterium]